MDFVYPKTRRENLAWRRKMLIRCRHDLEYRAKVKELFHRDILFAFNAFFFTLDVRKRPFHHIPFMTWEYQDPVILDLQECIAEGRDIVIEKTRDMGASWVVILVMFHAWLDPKGGADFLLGSRIEKYVDEKGNMRTLFAKLRYAFKKLPKWLRPKGFEDRKHNTFMKLENPETGSVIGGESNNANFSTGGRYAAILYDEFAKWEGTDEAAWTAGGDATPCRIAVSTPFGAGGQYYFLVTDGKTKRIRLHWELHPEKSFGISCVWPPLNEDTRKKLGDQFVPEVKLVSPWYEKECLRRTASEIAQELDIDYIGAGHPVFDGHALRSLKYYHALPDKPLWWAKLNIDELTYERLDQEPFDLEGYVYCYEEFNSDERYTTGWDIVEGVEGGDFLVGTVLNRVTKNVTAKYFSRFDEVIAARVIYIIQQMFSPEEDSSEAPWCGIETTGPGLSTFDFCVLLGMTNLFMAPRYDVTKQAVSYRKGWKTDTASRHELISGIRRYLIDRAGELHSQRLVGELLTFVRTKTGKAEAKAGCHDDEVFSFGIALQVDELAPFDYEEIQEAKKKAKATLEERALVSREDFRIEGEPTTIEERCLAQSLAMQAINEYDLEELFYIDGGLM